MRTLIVSFLPVAIAFGFDISPVQPSIGPGGVVNAASYISQGFANYGIARGSLFLVFGNHLGPDTLVQAGSYPLPSSAGLAGTRVLIDAPGYTAEAFMLYTSTLQVAAIMPSNAPEGDATLTVNYGNRISNPVVIRVVRSAFGSFTLDQAGGGQAVIQNFVSQSQTPLNTVMTPATPGQTVILWGTGLGPVNGDEAAGPLPGSLPFLDTLYVGGQRANVRFAGRSGCCAGIDQIVFDVPANVSGCYVPVVAVTNGVIGNSGTIAVSASGGECDDPLSFRSTDLTTLRRNGVLRVGTIALWNQTPAGASLGSNTLSGSFVSYTPDTLIRAQAPVNPSVGACYITESPVTADPGLLPHGNGLNAGFNVVATGPPGSLTAEWVSPGNYTTTVTPAGLPAGVYSLSAAGGPDIGLIRGTFTVAPAVQWTNAADYAGVIRTGQAMSFSWTGGDSGTYVTIRINSVSATLSTSILCNLPAAAHVFTVPDFMARTIVQGGGTLAVGSFGAPGSFSAPGLDVGTFTVGATTVVRTNFQNPPGGN